MFHHEGSYDIVVLQKEIVLVLPYDSFLWFTSATVLFEFDLMALIKF